MVIKMAQEALSAIKSAEREAEKSIKDANSYGERIIGKAKDEAEKIVEFAKMEAEDILSQKMNCGRNHIEKRRAEYKKISEREIEIIRKKADSAKEKAIAKIVAEISGREVRV